MPVSPNPSRLRRSAAALVYGVVVLGMGVLGYWGMGRFASERPELPAKLQTLLARRAPVVQEPPRVIYLNREGARVYAGTDAASHNISSLVKGVGLPFVDYPAFAGAAAVWDSLVRCVEQKFAPFGVRIVDTRPLDEGDYVMAMIGGDPSIFEVKGRVNPHRRATGLAPFNGEVIRQGVVMVFSNKLNHDVTAMCDTAAMEVAHVYGLDHAYSCGDLMTYLKPCGPRTFRDEAVACGEHQPRACHDGGLAQNSYRRLLGLLGSTKPSRVIPKGFEDPATVPQVKAAEGASDEHDHAD